MSTQKTLGGPRLTRPCPSYDNNDQLGDGTKIEDIVDDWDEDTIEKNMVEYGVNQFGTSAVLPLHVPETESRYRRHRAWAAHIGWEGEKEACSRGRVGVRRQRSVHYPAGGR